MAALGADAAVAVLAVPGSHDLQLAAFAGYDERDALDWRDLGLSSDSPLAEAVRTCRVVGLPDRGALRERFPGARGRARAPRARGVGRGADRRRRRGARRRACSPFRARGRCRTTTRGSSSCCSARRARRSTAPRSTSASATSPRRSSAACSPRACRGSPASTWPRSTGRRATATRSAATSTTSSRRPTGASSWRSATCRARARRRRR